MNGNALRGWKKILRDMWFALGRRFASPPEAHVLRNPHKFGIYDHTYEMFEVAPRLYVFLGNWDKRGRNHDNQP